MKRYKLFLGLLIACIAALTIGSKGNTAYAFDANDINNYFQANNVYIDGSGNLIIQWQRVNVSPIPYDLPQGAIIPVINGTSSISSIPSNSTFFSPAGAILDYEGPGPGFNIHYAIAGNGGGTPGGCAPHPGDGWAGASTAVSGNSATFSNVWDGSAGTYVPTTGISLTTPIYFAMVSIPGAGCSYGSTSYLSSQQTYVNSINEPLTSFFIYPFQSGTFTDFPSWSLDLSNNTSTEATGTIGVYYGAGTSTQTLVDTSTFDIPANADTNIVIPKSNPLTYPQQGSSTLTWNAVIQVTSANQSTTINPIVFYTNPLAQPITQNPIQNVFNQSTTNEYSVNCSYTSSSFFSDPGGNIQQGFCNVMVWAFIPTHNQSQDLSSRFSGIGTLISTKPPFGYFGLIVQNLNGLNQSSTATTTLMDATTTAIIAGTFSTLDDGLAAIIGFLFAMWIFHRFRLFNL